jgi:hypothetical protein
VDNGLGLTLLIFGVVALFAYLSNRSPRVLALAAMPLIGDHLDKCDDCRSRSRRF